MQIRSTEGINMKKTKDQQLYDAKAKWLLSRKDVFANILKYAVREF